MRDEVVIRVQNLGKRYLLGQNMARGVPYRTIREDLVGSARSLFQRNNATTTEAPEFWALRDVNFEVERGDVVGVIGRNGAGKSTLLKLLSRITEPTTGSIRIRGRVASLLEVGTGFHHELTGRENIFLNGAILGMSRHEIKAKFDEIVAFAEVEEFLDTPVKRYSSGMFVRLAFAVAAHLEPEILVVDEVLAVGDADFQRKCLGKMQDVGRSGRTVLFVSHNMDAVLRLCSKGLLLHRGQVVEHGDVKEVAARYVRSSIESGRRELHQIPRGAWLRLAARFVQASVTANGEESSGNLQFGSTVGVQASIEVERPLRDVEVGVSIFTAMGMELVSSLSSMYVQAPRLEAGLVHYKISFDSLQLLPGSYRISLGLRSEVGSEDLIYDALDFEVLPSEESSRIKADTLAGSIVTDATCEFVFPQDPKSESSRAAVAWMHSPSA